MSLNNLRNRKTKEKVNEMVPQTPNFHTYEKSYQKVNNDPFNPNNQSNYNKNSNNNVKHKNNYESSSFDNATITKPPDPNALKSPSSESSTSKGRQNFSYEPDDSDQISAKLIQHDHLQRQHSDENSDENSNEGASFLSKNKKVLDRQRRDSGHSMISHCSEHPEDESALTIAKQVFVPYVMAAIGLVGAGLFLDIIQHWEVYQVINELYVLVPSLLGLKGNLEMTLASRMSTAANQGFLDDPVEKRKIVKGNLALIQCQASVVALFAAIIAMTLSWIPLGKFDMYHALILCSAALYTAALASAILSSVMMFIIIKCNQYNINPDNVATPIAASLGDLTTLALLSWISNLLYIAKDSAYHWVIPLALFIFIALIPLWVYIAYDIKYTQKVLKNGWEPVIAAMFISSTGGFILEKAVNIFNGIAIYTPGMNGVGGNLAAIQASRISTYLHRKNRESGFTQPGEFKPEYLKQEKNCDCTTFTSWFKGRFHRVFGNFGFELT